MTPFQLRTVLPTVDLSRGRVDAISLSYLDVRMFSFELLDFHHARTNTNEYFGDMIVYEIAADSL